MLSLYISAYLYIAVSLALVGIIQLNLATDDGSKLSKRIVEGLMVNRFIEVLDKDVAFAGFAEGGVSLGPHDTAWSVLYQTVVECIYRSFG